MAKHTMVEVHCTIEPALCGVNLDGDGDSMIDE